MKILLETLNQEDGTKAQEHFRCMSSKADTIHWTVTIENVENVIAISTQIEVS